MPKQFPPRLYYYYHLLPLLTDMSPSTEKPTQRPTDGRTDTSSPYVLSLPSTDSYTSLAVHAAVAVAHWVVAARALVVATD